jgi:hypothetical protein
MNTQDYAYEVCNVVKAPNDELDSCLILQIQTVIIHKCLLLWIKLICEEKKGQNRKIKGLVTIRLNLINDLIAGDET